MALHDSTSRPAGPSGVGRAGGLSSGPDRGTRQASQCSTLRSSRGRLTLAIKEPAELDTIRSRLQPGVGMAWESG